MLRCVGADDGGGDCGPGHLPGEGDGGEGRAARLRDDIEGVDHSEAGRVRGLFQEEQRKIMFDGGRLINVAELGDLKGRLEGLTTELRAGINEIQAMGAVPKDLGQGLVDFPYLLGDEEVNLCWRFGEKHIRFWHGLDEGFAGRKRLPER